MFVQPQKLSKMYKNINNKEFTEGLNQSNSVLIDVRTPEEFHSGHLKNALNIDIMGPSFLDKINQLDKSKSYYIYCRSGGRSASACGAMASWGFSNLHNLADGIIGWDGEIVKE